DDFAALVPDWKHQPAPETIVSFTALVFHEQTAGYRVFQLQLSHQSRSGRISEPEPLCKYLADPSLFQYVPGRFGFRGGKHSLEIRRSLVMDVKELSTFFGFLVVEPPECWNRNAAFFGDDLYSLRKWHFFGQHHEIEDVSAGVTPETVKELLIPMNRKRRRLL